MTVIKKYDQNLMRYLNAFEQVTKIRPKDCYAANGTLIFLVEKGTAKVAIGRKGANAKELEKALKKKVKIIEWRSSAAGLVKSYLYPTRPTSVRTTKDNIVEIKFKHAKQRRILLSDRQARLHELQDLVQHFHPDIREIKVL